MEGARGVKKMPMQLESGDILFYKSRGSITDRIIAWFTGSRYVHVGIALDNRNQIEARSNGVIRSIIAKDRVGAIWKMPDPPLDAEQLTRALVWLQMNVGKQYSYVAILDSVIEKIYHSAYVVQLNHYDCSGLASDFLMRAGYEDKLATILKNTGPDEITPAMLAKALELDHDRWIITP